MFWLVLSVFLFLFGCSASARFSSEKEKRLRAIDEEIEWLEEKQRGYEAKALRHEMLADRLQFRSGQYVIAKQHWEIAEKYRGLSREVAEKIARLKKEKQELLQKTAAKKMTQNHAFPTRLTSIF
ncbi:MAG: hypothetical protein AAGI90_05145 [Chlamydiota bacterium]